MENRETVWSKLLNNKKLLWGLIGGAAALLVAVGVILAVCLGGGDSPMTGCTITVKSEAGVAMEGVGIYVYTDETMLEMVTFAKTNAEGKIVIDAEVPVNSVAVLDGLAAGYVAEEFYLITKENTEIVLDIELLKQTAPITVGSVMFDFTVTDTEGTTHTLSELLKKNKAVVLNLWYTNCGPCKAEFPYLQKAYDLYGQDIALLALNCYPEDDAAAVSAFKAANGLTFPMAKCDSNWESLIKDMAYPATIVIDRYGIISLLHIGGIDDAGVFAGVFEHYKAADYVQSVVTDIRSLAIEIPTSGEGTKENPVELSGVTEFEVKVEPGATVYYNLYRVSGMELKVRAQNLTVLYENQQHLPAEGLVSCLLKAQDPMTPALVAFTNTGATAQTYKVTLSAPAGSQDNPFTLALGDFAADISAGNFQGVFYTYSADASGEFILTVKKAPSVSYSLILNNLTSGKYLSLGENGQKDADGNDILVVKVNRKDQLQIIVAAEPDAQGAYPAVKVELNAAEKAKQDVGGNTSGGNTSGGNTSGGNTSDGNTSGGNTSGDNNTGNYNGTLVNPEEPVEQFGFNDFSIEVGAGEKKLVYIARAINKATLCIYNKDAYVVYKNTTYKPDNTGAIYIPMESEGSFNPLQLEIGNAGTAAKTFEVVFAFEKGSRENPGTITVGENTISCTAGNEQGTFYTFKANAAGTLTIEIRSIDPTTVVCGISINDMQAIPNVVELEEGATSLSIALTAGTEAEITFFTKDPNKEWKIPAAEIVVNVTYQ